jgi:hypothetical protein
MTCRSAPRRHGIGISERTLSSAAIGIGTCSRRDRARGRAPGAVRAARHSVRPKPDQRVEIAATKPWLPSTPSHTSGRAARIAAPALMSSSQIAGQLDLDRLGAGIVPRPCAITSGVSAPRVKVVRSGGAGPDPPASRPVFRLRAASSSHIAQSTALRAPPGGMMKRSSSRLGAGLDRVARRLERGEHVRHIVAHVEDATALAAPLVLAVTQRHHDDVRTSRTHSR